MGSKDSPDRKSGAGDQYVVAVGASAGGLEPIQQFFHALPSNTGFSFVLIQHLSPDHKSLMRELLGKYTTMPLVEAAHGMEMEPDHIYLIPNKKLATLEGNRFRLVDKDRNLHSLAIDNFFSSLAREKKSQAVGVILSGSGSDGSRGIESIKKEGGWVFVQDPATADFDSMPAHAVATGKTDMVLPAESLAEELVTFLNDPPFMKSLTRYTEEDDAIVDGIIAHIRTVTPHDFSLYKKPTIKRRIAKRIGEKGFRSITDYKKFLEEDTEEALLLAKEFLINVTKFFRDTEAFAELKEKIIPAIFESRQSKDSTIKVWVAACSTGEEAYSLAILLHEHMEAINDHNANVKIFATDIDKEAVQIAATGVFPEYIARDVGEKRLHRYFIQEGLGYKIAPFIRKMVVFACHDVTRDPPFSKIDLVSCRNLLIYMNTTLQKSVLRTFLFSLQTGGYLFLGSSENVGVISESMKEVSKKWKIYQCVHKVRSSTSEALPRATIRTFGGKSASRPRNAYSHLDEIFRDTLLEEYPCAGVLVDESLEVRHAIGRYREFLNFPENNFSFNLIKLVDTDLGIALGTCLRRATQENTVSTMRHVRVDSGEKTRFINILIKPYLRQQVFQQSFLFVVLKEEAATSPVRTKRQSKSQKLDQSRFDALEKELRETKENLQSLVEELESANEELMTSNEEMISANEELQSANEELQSINEELHTVSAEHQAKIRELIELNDDLNNYFSNSEIGQILVDKNLIIRKFSPAVTRQVNLIESDIGRSIADITSNIDGVNLFTEIRKVITTNRPFRREVTTHNDKTYLMKIKPYVRQDRTNDGAVVNFIDVSEVKNLNGIINGIFESSANGIMALRVIRDEHSQIIDFEFTASNHAADAILGFERGFLQGRRLQQLEEVRNVFLSRYTSVVETGREERFEHFINSSNRWFDVVVVRMMDGVVTTFTDVTQKRKAAETITRNYEDLKMTSSQLQQTNQMLEQSNMDLLQFASVASHDLKEPLRKIQTFGNFLAAKIEGKLDPQEKSYLDKIVSASHRMQVLIEDVLTLSKLSNKEIPFVETDLDNIVRRIIDDLEITIREKNGIIEIDQLPKIEAVPGQMRQLFQNLIANALKFTGDRQPVIRIQQRNLTRQEEQDFCINAEDFVVICVSDNGIGFEEKFRDKIFGLFQRLNPTQYQGTGIGLAICKKIVDNHAGFIKAESRPGSGATFMLLLPKRRTNF